MAVVWGQAAQTVEPTAVNERLSLRHQEAEVIVEPGSAGRFWGIEIRMGDSHTYSDINLALQGVPPYLARSPEEWFDAETGKHPKMAIYDETAFIQSDQTPETRATHPLVHHWSPCPALGDPDTCELRCPTTIALWNPEARPLHFSIASYLPRNMFPLINGQRPNGGWKTLPEKDLDHAHVIWTNATGRTLLDKRIPLRHQHAEARGFSVRPGRGVSRIEVTDAEHFWAYTYPATPAVLVGRAADEGWRRFHLEAGTARNWYFFVPTGTTEFSVRVGAADETDIVHMKVNAPDRTMAVIYDRQAERKVRVPEGLSGKIWHVRLDFGSATRFDSRLPRPRFPSLKLTLDFRGVPPYLAPTWEQWFDPERPVGPYERKH
jgi:hypothetical protein